jgi:DNA-binding MarR family transcriptional regulator
MGGSGDVTAEQAAASDLAHDAEEVERQLRAIRRRLWQACAVDLRHASLTMPQVEALHALVREDGLVLTVLSHRLGLAQSTVSGIVDRLARQDLVERRADPADGRVSRVYLTGHVKAYLRDVLPQRRLGPLIAAFACATPEERARVLEGLSTLRRLLEAVAAESGGDACVPPASGRPHLCPRRP